MSNRCLITTLKGNVNDDNILRFGEFTINCFAATPNRAHVCIRLVNTGRTESLTVRKLSGEGNFTLSARTDERNIFVDGPCTLAVGGKYETIRYAYFQDNTIVYCNELKYTTFTEGIKSGFISGNVTDLPIKTEELRLNYITGDFNEASDDKLNSIKSITIHVGSTTKAKNIIKNLNRMPNIDMISMQTLDEKGTVSDFSNLLRTNGILILDATEITGDFATLPHNISVFNCKAKSVGTWSNRDTSYLMILHMNEVNYGEYLTTMLINNSNCVFRDTSKLYCKTLKVKGSYNGSSDLTTIRAVNGVEDAISRFLEKGVVLYINGENISA